MKFICSCGHEFDLHMHYRRGNDCGFCECRSYRPASLWRRILQGLGFALVILLLGCSAGAVNPNAGGDGHPASTRESAVVRLAAKPSPLSPSSPAPTRRASRSTPRRTVPPTLRPRTGSGYATPRRLLAPSTRQKGDGVWYRLAQCESSGNWSINTGNGFYGGLQFTRSSWRAVGGSGMPHNASIAEQIKRGKLLLAIQGWGAWPACSRKLGLRKS